MIQAVRYSTEHKTLWDQFLARSRNAVFLFARDYMEYHADRFVDHSLLFFDESHLIALLPANVRDGVLYSHGGLTYGGILSDERMRTATMLAVFEALKAFLKGQGIGCLVYKAIPHIYHRLPAEEDLYALFVHDARLIRRDIASTIWMKERPPLTKGRKWSVKKARSNGLEIRQTRDFARFMAVEEEHLQKKYGVKPTHSGEELQRLADRFPNNIKLFTAHRDDILVGGTVIYESGAVAHAQYIAATDQGKELGALDCLFDRLLNETYLDKKYFDFGISTENSGRYLNLGLIDNKESYGARGIAYDFYELDIAG